jgi:hypothetical protein
MQDWAAPHWLARRHWGAASCSVTHTPARQAEPDVPSQHSTSATQGVRQTALMQSCPSGHSDDARHCGRGPVSGLQTPAMHRSPAAVQLSSLVQRAWQFPLIHVAAPPQSRS